MSSTARFDTSVAAASSNMNFTVLSPEQEERLRKLEGFYEAIRAYMNTPFPVRITDNDIRRELSKVDSNWYSAKLEG